MDSRSRYRRTNAGRVGDGSFRQRKSIKVLLMYTRLCFPKPEMQKGVTFDILVFVFRYRKCEKVLRNRLFGYSTDNNHSEGAILSWIAPYGYPQTNQGERLRNARSVFSMPLPLINPFPRGYMLVSKISETLK